MMVEVWIGHPDINQRVGDFRFQLENFHSFLQNDERSDNPFRQFIAVSGGFSKLKSFLLKEEWRMSRGLGDVHARGCALRQAMLFREHIPLCCLLVMVSTFPSLA
jgi:hypothetical protein